MNKSFKYTVMSFMYAFCGNIKKVIFFRIQPLIKQKKIKQDQDKTLVGTVVQQIIHYMIVQNTEIIG